MNKFLVKTLPKYARSICTSCNEREYLNLVNRVMTYDEIMRGRNGDTITSFGEKMEFSLQDYHVPVLTTKKFAWKTCLKELLWFISGDTNNKTLSKQNVGIWNKNASTEFKDTIGLHYEDKGDLGPIYGHQWRFFNAEYKGCNEDYSNQGVDQLQNIIDALMDPDLRYSRRLVMSAWNPCQLHQMVLPPCHILTHFSVNSKDELSAAIYQRSGDIGLGIPFNIASYSFLVCLLAQHCNLSPNKLVHFIGDAHIYTPHLSTLKEQLALTPLPAPIFRINSREHINEYTLRDFALEDYNYHSKMDMEMIA